MIWVPTLLTAGIVAALAWLKMKGLQPGDLAVVPFSALPATMNVPPALQAPVTATGAAVGLTVTDTTGSTVTGTISALVMPSGPVALNDPTPVSATVDSAAVFQIWRDGKKIKG